MTPAAHLETLARHLVAGRYDLLADRYAFPLPVYVDTERRVVDHAAQLWPMYQGLHALLRAGGFSDLQPRLASIELPRRERFRMWTDWLGLRDGSRPETLFSTLCYNEGSHTEFRSVMLQFDTRSWPQLSQVLAA